MNRIWLVSMALLGVVGCGHPGREERANQYKVMLDELTFIREDLKQQQKQLATLQKQLQQQAALLAALKELREQVATLDRKRQALEAPPAPREGVSVAPGRSVDYAKIFKRTGTDLYTIRRADLNRVLANSTELARAARIIPALENGRPIGFKLFGIRPNSLYASAGLQNGDLIMEMGGLSITTPENALEAYAKLRRARSIEVKLKRRGAVRVLRFSIEG